MAKRKENMLEAFQASAGEEPEGREIAPSALDVGGPFAPAAEVRVPRLRERRPAAGDSDLALAPVAMPFGSLTFVLIQILLLAGSFALGRLTAGHTAEANTDGAALEPAEASSHVPSEIESAALEAAAKNETAAQPQGEAAASKGEAQGSLTEFDRAFQNPDNRFTIQVIQYGDAKSDWMRTMAYRAYDHLFARGLPVVKPMAVGKHLIIFVGAARNKADLEETLAVVRKTPGPDRGERDAFSSALVVNIPR